MAGPPPPMVNTSAVAPSIRVTGAANAASRIDGSADNPVINPGAEADRPLIVKWRSRRAKSVRKLSSGRMRVNVART